jgi:hypothetical protein
MGFNGDGARALREQLGGRLPNGLGGLEDHEMADLAAAIEVARRGQADDLERAIERSLRKIPFPLRGRARKAVFG